MIIFWIIALETKKKKQRIKRKRKLNLFLIEFNKRKILGTKNNSVLLSVSILTKYYFLPIVMIKSSIVFLSNSCASKSTNWKSVTLGLSLTLVTGLLGRNRIISLGQLSVNMKELNWATATCPRNLTSNDALFCVDLIHLPLPSIFSIRTNSKWQLKGQE